MIQTRREDVDKMNEILTTIEKKGIIMYHGTCTYFYQWGRRIIYT
jgi:hypothetical protein